MRKILIRVIIFIFFIAVIIGLVGMYKFNVLQDDIYIEGASLTIEDQNTYLLGSWIEPIPGNEKEFQGFTLNSDGTAQSINMATLQYQKWQFKDGKLILTAKSTGNKTSSVGEEVYTVISVNENYLFLKNREIQFIYKKRQPL
ncbi:MAG: lipocalin family protein [Psychrilyobacter sp.]|uniref:lipocalin family protein n=1 Tax=Psychrilyobacter sp. TaxID=2586924 RepID=UPI003C70B13D